MLKNPEMDSSENITERLVKGWQGYLKYRNLLKPDLLRMTVTSVKMKCVAFTGKNFSTKHSIPLFYIYPFNMQLKMDSLCVPCN